MLTIRYRTFAAVLAPLAALVAAAAPITGLNGQTAAAGAVDISVTGLRSARGNVLICLTANPRKFPDCRGDSAARTLSVSASTASGRFAAVGPGTYAIAIIHDENGNGRMDTLLGIPREGVGASRNAAGRMGPPRFAEASFVVGNAAVGQSIRMRYIF